MNKSSSELGESLSSDSSSDIELIAHIINIPSSSTSSEDEEVTQQSVQQQSVQQSVQQQSVQQSVQQQSVQQVVQTPTSNNFKYLLFSCRCNNAGMMYRNLNIIQNMYPDILDGTTGDTMVRIMVDYSSTNIIYQLSRLNSMCRRILERIISKTYQEALPMWKQCRNGMRNTTHSFLFASAVVMKIMLIEFIGLKYDVNSDKNIVDHIIRYCCRRRIRWSRGILAELKNPNYNCSPAETILKIQMEKHFSSN